MTKFFHNLLFQLIILIIAFEIDISFVHFSMKTKFLNNIFLHKVA